MDEFDRSRAVSRDAFAPGTILIRRGSDQTALTILHSGLAEVLETSHSTTSAAESARLGRRVGLIKGESLCGVTDLREPGPARRTIRAVTRCVVSNIPVAPTLLAERLYSDPELNLRVLQGLVQRVESSIYLFRNYKYLWHKLAVLSDSIALAYDFGKHHERVEEADRETSSLENYSSWIRARTIAAELELPVPWDPNVLLGRIQDELGLYAEHDAITEEATLDLPQFLFVKRLLGRSEAVVHALIADDEPGTVYLYQLLSRSLESMIDRNRNLVDEIELLLDRLFATGGWIATALEAQTGSDEEHRFGYYLGKTCYRFHKDCMNLLGRRLADEYPVYRHLGKVRRSDEEPVPESTPATDPRPARDPLAKYRNLADRLLEFSGLTQKERSRFSELLEAFKQLPERLADDAAARAVRDELGTLYWRLYESCFLKVIETDLKSFIPGIMLHFGLVDETLVGEDDLRALDAAYARALYTDDTIPVMTLPYFLEKIYKGEQNPSFTEMGETFAKRLKTQQRMTRKERDSGILYEDTPEDRVRFELRNIVASSSGLLFGSRRRALPILCRDAMAGDAQRLFQEPEDVARGIDEVRSRDFTLFYRDVGLHHRYGTDIVRKEVIPNFVLYPVVGSRIMLWQELDGTSRHSAGRIFLPLFFSERFDETIIATLGQFRWELQKSIAGASWMDPVEGGLVGAYYDYINFYRKNPNMTSEAKERLKSLVSKTRSDRDRFAIEYANWIRYEYEGKIRLNPVARAIFYRYCPFPKTVREAMARKPLYADLDAKYENRVRQSILKLESRVRRFERSEEPLPQEMADYLEMLRS